MPIRQAELSHDDFPFDPHRHGATTKGRRGECTYQGCSRKPTVSRRWENDAYQDGWWGSYCREHADQSAELATSRNG